MARRYRYAIIKKKEAAKGKLSVGLAIASVWRGCWDSLCT